jgi:hypothetical protein
MLRRETNNGHSLKVILVTVTAVGILDTDSSPSSASGSSTGSVGVRQKIGQTMDRKVIVETIRAHAAKHGVVWLTKRGAIVFAPDGSADLIKEAGRKFFKEDCLLLFITGTVGLSVMLSESIGSAVDDERMHELMWKDFDEHQVNPVPADKPLKVADEVVEKAGAKHICEVLSALPEDEQIAIRNADNAQRREIISKFMDKAVRRAVKEIRERRHIIQSKE